MKKILECENWMGLLKTKVWILLPNGKKVNPNDILEYTKHTALYRVYPASGKIMIGRYPGRADTFMPEAWCVRPELAEDLCKKNSEFSSER